MSIPARLCILIVCAGLALLPGCAGLEEILARVAPEEATADAAPRAAAPARRPHRMSPRRLAGNSEAQIVALLGQPASVREEPPAMVWRYQEASGCGVDVFFYFDVASEAFRSLAYKFLTRKLGRPQDEEECLAALRGQSQMAKEKAN